MTGKLYKMIKKYFVLVLVMLISAGSMDVCAQSKKSENTPRKYRKYKTKEAKFEAAKAYYNKGLYLSAAELFEQVYPMYMGSVQGDSILFLFASSYYKNDDYLMAAFHFNDFVKKYPYSPRAEEAAFMAAKSHFMNIPAYNLDQTDALLAKDGLESFLESHPGSVYNSECNVMLDTIRNQLARKEYAAAYLYYRIGQYAAAEIAYNNLLKDYPGSIYAEKALYDMVRNSYEYAGKSVPGKQGERYQKAIDYHYRLEAKFPQSPYLTETKKMAETAAKKRDIVLKENNF